MNISSFLASLPIMGLGMLGIFIVISIIIFVVWILQKFFSTDKNKSEDNN